MNKAVVNGGFLIGVRFIGIAESLPVDTKYAVTWSIPSCHQALEPGPAVWT